jgi:transcriptional regulator with XRE-family HTH domain
LIYEILKKWEVLILIKDRLKQLRKSSEYTQGDLSKKLNVPISTYSNWEQGTRNPDYEKLIQLADIYDCTVDYLVGRTDFKKENIGADEYSLVVRKARDAKIPPPLISAYIDFLKDTKLGF